MSWSKLVDIIAQLRSPEGCPWDREQTHHSLRRYLLEESYELLEAIEQESPAAIKDELGDVLLQVLLHAQIAQEQGDFSIDDVLENLAAKMVRRHPHIFADSEAATPRQVAQNWEKIKETEQAAEKRHSALDGVPRVFPALMRAEKIQKKAATVGFDWPDPEGPLEKVNEELAELKSALAAGDEREAHEEFGDLLFAAVNLSRFLRIDPEFALQQATAKFEQRFHLLEQIARAEGADLATLDLAALDRLWDRAKAQLRKNPQD